jgi:hypothetical protein
VYVRKFSLFFTTKFINEIMCWHETGKFYSFLNRLLYEVLCFKPTIIPTDLKGKYCSTFGRITSENNGVDIQNLQGLCIANIFDMKISRHRVKLGFVEGLRLCLIRMSV